MMRARILRAWVTAGALLALAACGGDSGGGAGSIAACLGGNVEFGVDYPGLGTRAFRANLGSSFDSGLPDVDGLSPACAAQKGFQVTSGQLPPGWELDPTTGRIVGTATAAGHYPFAVGLTLDAKLASPQRSLELTLNAIDPGVFTISGWNQRGISPAGVRFDNVAASDGRLLAAGSRYTVVDGQAALDMVTVASIDRGATWTQVSAGVPAPGRDGFSMTGDGHAVYFAGGGASGLLNDVWKFDGAAWTQRTASAAFSGRQAHAMVKMGTSLFVIGGRDLGNGTGSLPTEFGDVWKSLDDGATWQQIAVPFAGLSISCGTVFQERLVVITGDSALWESNDGVTWNRRVTDDRSPLRAIDAGACGAVNGRLYLLNRLYVVSSPDLLHWQFEPSLPDVAVSNGARNVAVLGGRLYVGMTQARAGAESASSRIFESTP